MLVEPLKQDHGFASGVRSSASREVDRKMQAVRLSGREVQPALATKTETGAITRDQGPGFGLLDNLPMHATSATRWTG